MPLRFVKNPPAPMSILLWYLRGLGAVYFVAGLWHWSWIVGITGEPLDQLAPHIQVAAVYFALLQVVAAVGLWAGAAWGVAAWLFAAVAAIVMHIGFTNLFGPAWWTIIFHFVTILTYVGLAWWTGSTENTGEVLRLPPE